MLLFDTVAKNTYVESVGSLTELMAKSRCIFSSGSRRKFFLPFCSQQESLLADATWPDIHISQVVGELCWRRQMVH